METKQSNYYAIASLIFAIIAAVILGSATNEHQIHFVIGPLVGILALILGVRSRASASCRVL
jgi:hypothetical protein